MRLIDADAFKANLRNALEQTRNAYSDKGEWAENITEQFCEAIDDQPTVYPDPDTVSRQQAIDALKEALNPSITNFVKAKLAIEKLPPSPIRPQIHCNKCNHYQGVHNVQGHAPCDYWKSWSVLWNEHCSHAEPYQESEG